MCSMIFASSTGMRPHFSILTPHCYIYSIHSYSKNECKQNIFFLHEDTSYFVSLSCNLKRISSPLFYVDFGYSFVLVIQLVAQLCTQPSHHQSSNSTFRTELV